MSNLALQLNRLGVTHVPDGWNLSNVGTACTIRNDLRLPLAVEVREGMKGEFPYYGPTGVLGYIDECRVDGEYALIGEDGDHFLDIYNKTQTIRVSGLFNVNNHAHIVGSGPNCEVDWFFYFFQHRDIYHSLTRQGAGRFKLTKAALEKLPILLPPLGEQREIAIILRAWDEAIERLEALSKAKGVLFGWLSGVLFTKGSRSRDWKSQCLGDHFFERIEKTTAHNQHPSLTSSRRGIFLQTEYFSRQVTSSNNTGYKIIRNGDFTFRSMSDDGVFVFNQQNLVECGLISPAYSVFYPKNTIDGRFLYYLLNSPPFRGSLAREAQGGTRTALKLSALKKIHVDLPALEEQRSIAEALDDASRDISLVEESIDQHRRQKRGLMQKLLTGEWRVNVNGGAHG